MKNSIGRVLLLLAASDASRDELRSLSRWLLDEHPDELYKRVQEIRSYADKNSAVAQRPISAEPQSNKLRDEVERLLIDGAGMRRVEAASLLRELMVESGRLEPSFLPWNSGSFGAWLNKLAKVTSSSDVLHAASRLSLERRDGSASAWPLK